MIQTELGHKRREEGEGEGREVRGGSQGAKRKHRVKMAGLCKKERLGEEKQKPSL